MSPANLGAVRLPFLAAAVLASFAVNASAQVVEKGRTLADLIASRPCDSGLTDRIARVTDCDAADDIGDGGGAFNCWVTCDGSAPWANLAIGAGGGGLPGADEVTESMLKSVNAATDEYVLTYESTVGDFEWAQHAPTASALAANGGNCSAGSYPLGVDASGAVESCTVAGMVAATGSVASPAITMGGDTNTGFYSAGDGYWAWSANGTLAMYGDLNNFFIYRDAMALTFGAGTSVGLKLEASGILRTTNGSTGVGWVYADGYKALAADFTNATATPANLAGLTVTLKTGRKYTYSLRLSLSDSVAGEGLLIDFDGGTATATDFTARCKVHDTALLLATTTTALATDVAVATATGASDVECFGDFEVNAAGTFIPRAAQNSHSSGTLTVDRGSFLHVVDTSFN